MSEEDVIVIDSSIESDQNLSSDEEPVPKKKKLSSPGSQKSRHKRNIEAELRSQINKLKAELKEWDTCKADLEELKENYDTSLEINTRLKDIEIEDLKKEKNATIANQQKEIHNLKKQMKEKDAAAQKTIAAREKKIQELENELQETKMENTKAALDETCKGLNVKPGISTGSNNDTLKLFESRPSMKNSKAALDETCNGLNAQTDILTCSNNDTLAGGSFANSTAALDETHNIFNVKQWDSMFNNDDTIVKVTKLSCVGQSRDVELFYPNVEEPTVLSSSDFHLKLQIDGELSLSNQTFDGIIKCIHSCKLISLDLGNARVGYNDFMKLISSRTIRSFSGGYIKQVRDGNTVILTLAEVLKELPFIQIFNGKCSKSEGNDCKNIDELPQFPNLQQFTLSSLKPSFELENFAGFIQKHPEVEFYFHFNWVKNKEKENFAKTEKIWKETIFANCNVSLKY